MEPHPHTTGPAYAGGSEDAPNAAAGTAEEERAGLAPPAKANWTFLTNHARVLLCIAQEPGARIRDVARLIGLTERSVQRILTDLTEAGYVSRIHQGRRNHYVVHSDIPFRRPTEQCHQVSTLLGLMQRCAGTSDETGV